MTAYNRERYIAVAIESVLASGFKDFELIIVDDHSTDNTMSIIRLYKERDSRIRVYQNEKNLGDYPNRNKAASYAKGKYIKYVDSDDYIYPDGLKIMVDAMEKFPEAKMGLCSLKPDKHRPFPFVLDPKQAYEYQFFGPGLFYIGPLSAIFNRDSFFELGCFLPNRMVSDNHMWYKSALHYPVVLMSDGIVWARSHDDQQLNDAGKYLREYELIKWQYLKDPLCRLSADQLRRIKRKRIRRFTGFILSGLIRMKRAQVTGYCKCLYDLLRINTGTRNN